jgi:hypothetical protein
VRPEREPSESSSRSSSSDDSASSRRRAALAVAAATPAQAGDEEPAASEPAKATSGPDLKAIAKAVSAAARSASSCGDSPQSGKVALTFSPSGSVRSVQMEEAFAERDVGSCVLRAMGRAKVAAFTGDPVMVRKSVTW